MLTVVSDICLYPTSTGGSSSFSGMMRTNEWWHGTLVIDEGDISGDKENQVIKYLNLGFEHGKYFMLSDKNDPRQQEVFDPFNPKIIGMREHFRDNATESRRLSISPHETTDVNILIILNKAYYKESAAIRNYIARFVLEYWPTVDGEKLLSFRGLGIEPRLQQLAMPLSIIFQLWEGGTGTKTFFEYILQRQHDLRKQRALSWEGNIFNLVLSIALGDEKPNGFDNLYNSKIEAITPTMIAKTLNNTPKTVTQTLLSIGFQVEQRYITEITSEEDRKLEKSKKRVRCYVIPDEKTWVEIIQRYYVDEDGTDGTHYRTHKQKNNNGTDGTHTLTINNLDLIDLPKVLKSKRYTSVISSVPSVPQLEVKDVETTTKDIDPRAFDEEYQNRQTEEARERMQLEQN